MQENRSASSPRPSEEDRQPLSPEPAAVRTPAQVRSDGNHLQQQTSLYLKQHAHNPIDWYPWGEEALTRAQAESKPVFLSIGYSSCHWCHVMEHEVFDHDDVAEFMNRFFICIKVDREERPDLDAVYMDAVHAITGRGGWPLSVFLTPQGKPFFGGTYFPHDDFLELVRRIREVYLNKREEVTFQADQVARYATALPSMIGTAGPGDAAQAMVTGDIIAAAVAQASANFDLKWGGFKGEQKFPVPVRWQFLLHHYRKTGDRQCMNLVQRTLEAMASGGIYDHVGGGFHRYTVDTTWAVPHFEKMLYDNAQLASLYLEAGVVLQRADFLAVGKDVLDFLLQEMRDPQGAFCSSFDADSDGQEGSYYVWSPDDITIATNADDGPVLAQLLGVDEAGNFERGKNVLTRRTDPARIAEQHARDVSGVAGLFARHRQALRAHRARREAPQLDKKIVTSWNGLTISALCQGYAVTGVDSYRKAAEQAAFYLWDVHHIKAGRLHRVSNDGVAGQGAVLADYSLLAGGLLDLYQVTADSEHLSRALQLLDHATENFARPEGGYFLTPARQEAPLGRKVVFFDSVMPSGNAALLHGMIRAAALTGRSEYRQEVARALAAFAPVLAQAGLEMAGWLDAAQKFNGPFYEVIVAGDPGGDGTGELIRAFLSMMPCHAVLAAVPAGGAGQELAALMPPVAGKKAADGRAVAYVCEYGACQQPTSDPRQLRQQILQGWQR
jgi:uncharacterized protein YyaL (SSP411 family)